MIINKSKKSNDVVNIDVISDSPVFLTPASFLQNTLNNWNMRTILGTIGFDVDHYMDDESVNRESFPDDILDHALQRSKKDTDMIGMVTHNADRVSIGYYTLMNGGSIADLFGRDRLLSKNEPNELKTLEGHITSHSNKRRTDEVQPEWWSKMNNSMSLAMARHSNFDMFVMDGEGHCSFGLNVPLEYPGFESWSSTIVDESESGTIIGDAAGDWLLLDSPSESPTARNSTLSPTGLPSTDTSATAQTPPVMNNATPHLTFLSNFALAAAVALTWNRLFR